MSSRGATARLGPFASGQYVRLPPTAIRDLEVNDKVEVLARYLTEHERPRPWDFGTPLFCRTAVGRGTYYYLGAALDSSTTRTPSRTRSFRAPRCGCSVGYRIRSAA